MVKDLDETAVALPVDFLELDLWQPNILKAPGAIEECAVTPVNLPKHQFVITPDDWRQLEYVADKHHLYSTER